MLYKTRPEDFESDKKVAACYIEYKGKILLLRRSDDDTQGGGQWGCPGGAVDANETPRTAILREISEEIGLKFSEKDFIPSGEYYVHTKYGAFKHHIFRIVLKEIPDIKLSDEHSEYTFATPDDALTFDLVPDEDECIRLTYNKY